MSKRKAEPEPGTIEWFFKPGKAPVPSLDGPKSLFESDAERRRKVTVTQHGKPKSVYVYDCWKDGSIKGGCYITCTNNQVDFMHFAPTDGSSNSQAAYNTFVAAYDAYQKACAIGNRTECLKQRDILVRLRTEQCARCRKRLTILSPAVQECKDCYDTMRKAAAAAQNDGCAHADCPVRGPDAWQVLTADHGTNPKATNVIRKKKTGEKRTVALSLSHYTAWSKKANGGVQGMKKEALQIEKWICHCCHALEPTSAQGKRCSDPATMPRGKARGTKHEIKQNKAWKGAVIKYPKQAYIDDQKRKIGKCNRCARAVVPGTEPAFEFNHIDESTKCKAPEYPLFCKKGGVGGLANNAIKSATLDQVKALLDAEIAKCELLCANCHHLHTWKYNPSEEEF